MSHPLHRVFFSVLGLAVACGNPPEPLPAPRSSPTTSVTTAVASSSTGALPVAKTPPATPKRGLFPADDSIRTRYPWLVDGKEVRLLSESIDPPSGFSRVNVSPGSFGAFLRELPLRAPSSPVRSYRGELLHEGTDPRIAAVVELDVSPVDIQQCADSVIRLHAEWKWAANQADGVGYHFLSGDFATWKRYLAGERPKVDGNKVAWSGGASTKNDHASFRKYLDLVFNYASTISLASKSAKPIERKDVRAGDFFVLPGGPGHAILILDLAVDKTGKTVALLGQGFMPAQDFQVLSMSGNPWFSFDGEDVPTPFWPAPFPWSSLRRMNGDL